MAIVEIIYPAKCKDCKHLKNYYSHLIHKRRNKCNNPESSLFDQNVRLRDKACPKFEL